MRALSRLAGRVALSNLRDMRAPYRMTFALTYRCQLRCGMCNIWKKEPVREFTAAEIGTFFRKAPRFSWINLSGGEIFLRPDIEEVFATIAATCRDLYLLNFPTNGQETDRIVSAVAELLRSSQIPKVLVTVSMDGPPEVHDRLRGMPGAWERAVATFGRLRKLASSRFNVYLGMTLQDANAGVLDETVAAVRSRVSGFTHDDLHVNVMQTSHYYGNNACSGIKDKARIMEALAAVRSSRKKGGISPVAFLERRFQTAADRFLRTGSSGVACQALSASLFVDPAGTVFPCTMYDRPLGNLRDCDLDLRRLWDGAERRMLRKEIRKGTCPQCWTPCEAYQSILGDLVPRITRK